MFDMIERGNLDEILFFKKGGIVCFSYVFGF